MDNEQFQDLMLEQFGKVLTKLDGMESRMVGIESQLSGMDSRMVGVESRLSGMESHMGGVESRLGGVESRLGKVESAQIRMETEFSKKLDVLYYDWRETQKQLNEEIRIQIKNLSTKVEALQMESTKHDQEIKNLYLVKAPKV